MNFKAFHISNTLKYLEFQKLNKLNKNCEILNSLKSLSRHTETIFIGF